ncbi:hypothetical protein [Anabaena sp. CA = ATCC 33047]|uniref:hypothetical protein n=1 Tax=Anabaena sp. (strain CA / ATCC 33047) TaxID=52271 RepID=UPI0012EE46A2|nr:hypothetical protein [Anabaena sp. CA = ATCC 33047]
MVFKACTPAESLYAQIDDWVKGTNTRTSKALKQFAIKSRFKSDRISPLGRSAIAHIFLTIYFSTRLIPILYLISCTILNNRRAMHSQQRKNLSFERIFRSASPPRNRNKATGARCQL